MKIIWVIGLVLMSLYQYWVYSTFWIGEEDVRDVRQAKHIFGEISSIECIEVTKRHGQIFGEFLVTIKAKGYLHFSSRGTIRDCEKFYSRLMKYLSKNECSIRWGQIRRV